ncbi:MAG: sulfite exporter TauE/SafE family protein [bacterium]|nr:sulfite exporter TauE/SafE family protein [bacterium]
MIETLSLSSVPLLTLVFFVAAIYSSVGHGGASGYLAVLALFSLPVAHLSGTALVLNVLVSSLAFWSFYRAGHKLPAFSWMLVLVSVPFSFLGGSLTIVDSSYKLLLSIALILSALRLAIAKRSDAVQDLREPQPMALVGTGSSIGFLSGIVGVGGGIFLSPIAIFMRWTNVKSAATLSALFILVNSLSGIAGRAIANKLVVTPAIGLIIAALTGGIIGSHLGSRYFDGMALRRILAAVLLIAAWKLIVTHFG